MSGIIPTDIAALTGQLFLSAEDKQKLALSGVVIDGLAPRMAMETFRELSTTVIEVRREWGTTTVTSTDADGVATTTEVDATPAFLMEAGEAIAEAIKKNVKKQ